MEADTTLNFGKIRAVIGHEMSRGFDEIYKAFDVKEKKINCIKFQKIKSRFGNDIEKPFKMRAFYY